MPDLEMLLRDVRPAPEPAWAARLDTKVAEGFPRPPAAWKKPLIALREHLFAFGALASAASVAIVLIIVVANADLGGSDDLATGAKAVSTPASESADSATSG